jgi:signal peptidase I
MEETKTKKESLWELIRFGIIVLIIVIPVRMYIAQPFIVSGASMDPTFFTGEYLIVDEASFLVRDPQRGEVIIFRYPKDPSKYFIKRVIGLPGETVTLVGGKVTITGTDGKNILLDEPYVVHDIPVDMSEQLGPEEYFMMGDNRAVSYDSRVWGPVDRSLIKGRALVRLLPFNRIDSLPGEYFYKK